MQKVDYIFDKLAFHLSDVGKLSLDPVSKDGTLSLLVNETKETLVFACNFSEVMEHVYATEGNSLWPKMDSLSADMSLFSVHVEEAVDLAPPHANVLTWGETGLEAQRYCTTSTEN